MFLVLEDEWIKNCNRLPSKNIAALESPVDISKGVSSAIKVVSKSSRSSSKAGGISLQAPVSSGRKFIIDVRYHFLGLFKRRLKNFGKNFPSSLKFWNQTVSFFPHIFLITNENRTILLISLFLFFLKRLKITKCKCICPFYESHFYLFYDWDAGSNFCFLLCSKSKKIIFSPEQYFKTSI